MNQKLTAELREDLEKDLRDVKHCLQNSTDPDAALLRLESKLSDLSPSELTRFETLVRGYTDFHAPISDISKLSTCPRLALIWLFHGNGFYREAAIQHLPAEPLSSFFLIALFWRSNDWVPQIKTAAENRLALVLPHVSTDVATETVLFLFRRIKNWTKISQVVVGYAASLLQRKDVQEELIRRFTAGTGDCRTLDLNACLRFEFLDLHLPALAKNSRNPAIRRVALRVLQNGYAEVPVDVHTVITDKIYGKYKLVRNAEHRPVARYKFLPSLIRASLADRSVVVRRTAADGLILHRRSFRDVDALAKVLLADRKASIRERGDFLLRTTSDNKPRKQP